MKELIVILMSAILVNNYVLNKFLGICPFLGVSKKLNQAVGMGISVISIPVNWNLLWIYGIQMKMRCLCSHS